MSPILASLILTVVAYAPVPAQNVAPWPLPTAVENVRLSVAEDAAAVTLLLRDGRIFAVLEGEPTPPGFAQIDGDGALALPAFIDAGSDSAASPEWPADLDRPLDPREGVRVDMRRANRKGLHPSFRAADALALADDGATWRGSGFGMVLICPHGELLSGTSCLVIPREAAPRDTVVREGPFQHAAFQASGRGYPSTLMGYHAQLRQFFEDSRHQGLLMERRSTGRPGPRPPLDRDLEAGLDVLTGGRLMCDANTARDILRWIRLADEYGIEIAIRGGNEAWKVADTLAGRDIPVVLTLDWGEEVEDPLAQEDEDEDVREDSEAAEGDPDAGASPKDPDAEEVSGETAEDEGEEKSEEDEANEVDPWIYEEPLELRVERRRLWVEKRDGAQRLVEAGVAIAFGSGEDKPKDLLKRVRTLVEEGLDRDAALAALTVGAAGILEAPGGTGTLEVGAAAHVVLWNRDPLGEKKAKLLWVVLDGFPLEMADDDQGDSDPPDEGVDVTGSWEFEFDNKEARPASAELVMGEDGELTAKCMFTSPDGERYPMDLEGRVSGSSVSLKGETEVMEGFVIEVTLSGEVDGDSLVGKARWKGPGFDESSGFTGTREPDLEESSR